MKISIAQINPIIGDIEGNSRAIKDIILGARERGVRLVVFPELAVTGYPPRDLLEREEFGKRSQSAIMSIASVCRGGIYGVCGFVEPCWKEPGKPFYNSCALMGEGSVIATYRKMLLPSYDVFDETRWFEPGEEVVVVDIDGIKVGLTICEDIWTDVPYEGKSLYQRNPAKQAVAKGAECILNLSASPFTVGKRELRWKICTDISRKYSVPVFYCNQVGGNDELIFDGGSFVTGPDGKIVASGLEFATDVFDIEIVERDKLYGKKRGFLGSREEVMWEALKLGLSDYVRKCSQRKVWIGLSGGIDSAVVAVLATEALGSENVTCISMPSQFSSSSSTVDAKELAKNLGVRLIRVPISSLFQEFRRVLEPHFGNLPFDVTEENIQARIRGVVLMAFANKFGGIVLATGNKSEIATGYCTLYGDMVGGLSPIGDVFKTDVYALADFVNRTGEVIPRSIISKPPSAELRPGQKDYDTLPPYSVLDEILRLYVEEEMDLESIAKKGFDEKTIRYVLSMVRRAEYKRKQASVILKISNRAFGSGRRYPIARRYMEETLRRDSSY